jgi:hypothetical protein
VPYIVLPSPDPAAVEMVRIGCQRSAHGLSLVQVERGATQSQLFVDGATLPLWRPLSHRVDSFQN